ncbi:MAG: tripartite tricarboxylate transporter substrate binding protein [Alphaproteobacteria bacterium]|nr:tripartite tricarboxylate transporter substrate binding protein [Alphaproteobacteria bacterium]
MLGRRAAIAALGATALALAAAPATAQEWPRAQPIQIIGGFPTGAGTDIFARLLQEPLSKALGQTIIVENKSGAGGNVGSEFVARAKPDGYTFYMGTAGTHAINAALYPKLGFDVMKDFAHVALLVDVPNVLIVNPQILPDVKSCADMLQRAKKEPGRLHYASTGNGASTHLAGAQFADAAKVELTHIPYRGTPPALNAMMSGEAQIMFQQSIPIMGQLKAGTFRALGVTTAARIPALPDVPTLAEACGLPGWESTTWYGLFAPKATPEPILRRMNEEINRILREPAFDKRIADLGLVNLATTIEKFREIHAQDIEKWKERVKRSGAQVD